MIFISNKPTHVLMENFMMNKANLESTYERSDGAIMSEEIISKEKCDFVT